MKNAIKEYIELTEEQKTKLWKNAIFVFDTNVFIRLYSLTKEARDAFFEAIEKIKDRIWMPHQVAEEFMKNRVNVILKNLGDYDNLKQKTNNYIKELAQIFNIPETDKECEKHKNQLNAWIDKYRDSNLLVKDFSSDLILDKILNLFEGKTGKPYTSEEKEKMEKEGENRYKKQIPPGYKDDGKKKNEDIINNAYGDFFLWRQILDYSFNESKNIIFITNDKKEDWWNIVNGKTVGPRVELRKEFFEKTKTKQFHMYTLDSFLKYSTDSIDDKILEEVKINPENSVEILNEDYDDLINIKILHDRLDRLKHRSARLKVNYEQNEQELNFIRHSKGYIHRDIDARHYNHIMDKKSFLINEIMRLNEEIDRLTYEINSYRNKVNED